MDTFPSHITKLFPNKSLATRSSYWPRPVWTDENNLWCVSQCWWLALEKHYTHVGASSTSHVGTPEEVTTPVYFNNVDSKSQSVMDVWPDNCSKKVQIRNTGCLSFSANGYLTLRNMLDTRRSTCFNKSVLKGACLPSVVSPNERNCATAPLWLVGAY